jgi:hypothetical protein
MKTLPEFMTEVANEQGYKTWSDLATCESKNTIIRFMKDSAELYAAQFKSEPDKKDKRIAELEKQIADFLPLILHTKPEPMKPEFTSAILETTIICVNRAQEEMGIKSEEIDEKIVIDLREVISIRTNRDDEDDRPIITLYGPAENWTVLGDYDQVVKQWKAFKDY